MYWRRGSSRFGSPGRILWIVVSLIGALLVISGFVAWWYVGKQWEQMLGRTASAQAELEARPGERPALWGEDQPGCAFDTYREAVALMSEIDDEFQQLDDKNPRLEAYSANWSDWKTLADVSDVTWETVERLEPAFDLIQKAAHCRDGRRRISWESGTVKIGLDIAGLQLLQQHATLKAWRLIADGRHVEGIRLVLDLLQLGFDSFADPVTLHRVVGTAGIQRNLELFVVHWDPDSEVASPAIVPAPRVSLEELSPEARALLRAGLARLARRRTPPLSDTVRAEAVLMRWVADLPGLVDRGSPPFSDNVWGRFLVSDAVDRMWVYVEKLDAVENRWPALNALLDDWQSDLRKQWNPFYLALAPMLDMVAVQERKTWVAIRVVLMALSETDGHRSPLALADPFGTTIRRRVLENRTHYWSVGADGVDQKGDPQKDVVFVR